MTMNVPVKFLASIREVLGEFAVISRAGYAAELREHIAAVDGAAGLCALEARVAGDRSAAVQMGISPEFVGETFSEPEQLLREARERLGLHQAAVVA